MGERAKQVLNWIKNRKREPVYRVQGENPSPESLPRDKQSSSHPGNCHDGDRDGSSPEKAIVVVCVEEEYAWMQHNCSDFQPEIQSLRGREGKTYDVHTLCNDKGEKRTVYFDISGFY